MTTSIPGTEFPTATCTVCGHFHARREDGRILPSVDHEPASERTCSDCGVCVVLACAHPPEKCPGRNADGTHVGARREVETFENLDSHFMPFIPGQRLRQGATLLVSADGLGTAENAWVVGNREAADLVGLRWPRDRRSMSVGDVIHIIGTDEWFAAAPVGFEPIEEPTEQSLVEVVG